MSECELRLPVCALVAFYQCPAQFCRLRGRINYAYMLFLKRNLQKSCASFNKENHQVYLSINKSCAESGSDLCSICICILLWTGTGIMLKWAAVFLLWTHHPNPHPHHHLLQNRSLWTDDIADWDHTQKVSCYIFMTLCTGLDIQDSICKHAISKIQHILIFVNLTVAW